MSKDIKVVILKIDIPKSNLRDYSIQELQNSKKHGIKENVAYLFADEEIKDGTIVMKPRVSKKNQAVKCSVCGGQAILENFDGKRTRCTECGTVAYDKLKNGGN